MIDSGQKANQALIKAQFEIRKVLALIGPHAGMPTPTNEDPVDSAIGLLLSAHRSLNSALPESLVDDMRTGGNALNRLKESKKK